MPLSSSIHKCSPLALLPGCAYAPSINVFDAYFPDWLFCWVAGVIILLVVHSLIKLGKVEGLIPTLPLTYTLLAACFSLGVWLVFFPS